MKAKYQKFLEDIQDTPEYWLEALRLASQCDGDFLFKNTMASAADSMEKTLLKLHNAERLKDKLITDTGKGCSVDGNTPVVHVPDEGSNAYWLCGGCVSERLDESRARLYRLNHFRSMWISYVLSPSNEKVSEINEIVEANLELTSAVEVPVSDCEHDWVRVENEHVQGGALCSKCHMISAWSSVAPVVEIPAPGEKWGCNLCGSVAPEPHKPPCV